MYVSDLCVWKVMMGYVVICTCTYMHIRTYSNTGYTTNRQNVQDVNSCSRLASPQCI